MDMKKIIEGIAPADREWIGRARERTGQLVMPPRALGRLHEISEKMCGMVRGLEPSVERKAFLVMAGDHGVAAGAVSAYPQEVTGEMVKTFLRGGAGINALCRLIGAEVRVVDMGIIPDIDSASIEGGQRLHVRKVAPGTADLSQGPAMTREQAVQAVQSGFELAAERFDAGVQILGTGDMGIGNTTPSAAIGAVLTGAGLEEMVGRGTGVDDPGLERKRAAIRQGLDRNQPDPRDGLDVLARVGGFEIGGIAGCVLAGAHYQRPVVIDGFISTAGALVARALCPAVTDYLFAGHCSEEPGHRIMLSHMGLEPVLDLGMRLGEGTGAALAMGIIEGAVRVFREVLTFQEAGVTDKEEA